MRAVFDTGSANPWILSKQAADKNNRTSGYYDPSKSVTYQGRSEENKEWVHISFGSG